MELTFSVSSQGDLQESGPVLGVTNFGTSGSTGAGFPDRSAVCRGVTRLRREVIFKVSFVSYKRWHFKSCIATMEDPLRPKVGKFTFQHSVTTIDVL